MLRGCARVVASALRGCCDRMREDVPEDCRSCGACCFGTPRHVRVWGSDYARLGDAAESMVHWTADKAFLKLVISRCEQLEHRAEGVACRIYDRRPDACREFIRGSAACEAELDRRNPVALAFLGQAVVDS